MKFYYIVGEERKIRDEIELLDPSMWSGDEPLFGAYDWYYENDEFLETELSAANELGIGDERNYWERYQTYIEEWAERHSYTGQRVQVKGSNYITTKLGKQWFTVFSKERN